MNCGDGRDTGDESAKQEVLEAFDEEYAGRDKVGIDGESEIREVHDAFLDDERQIVDGACGGKVVEATDATLEHEGNVGEMTEDTMECR